MTFGGVGRVRRLACVGARRAHAVGGARGARRPFLGAWQADFLRYMVRDFFLREFSVQTSTPSFWASQIDNLRTKNTKMHLQKAAKHGVEIRQEDQMVPSSNANFFLEKNHGFSSASCPA